MIRNPRLALALAAAAVALTGCLTPRAHPQPSAAVLAARERHDAPPPTPCESVPLSEISPLFVGYDFGGAEVTPSVAEGLEKAVGWLSCHPQATVAIRPQADPQGSDAEQQALAQARAKATLDWLRAHGATRPVIQILPAGAALPEDGRTLAIRAEGQRW